MFEFVHTLENTEHYIANFINKINLKHLITDSYKVWHENRN